MTARFEGALFISPDVNLFDRSTAVSIYRVVDGMVVEGWHVYDLLDSYKQLGVIEITEEGKKLFPEDAS